MTNSLISPNDLSKEELNEIFNLAHQIISNPQEFSQVCNGKILATLFFEPSTRTRFSFEAAMMRLGGKILGFSEPNSSSTAKGETLADTIRMVSIYSDIIAMRHPVEGSAKLASMYSTVPLINAGDGAHQHPTQTLTDLLTIKSIKGTLEGNTIGICGDLKYGRTVASLITAMSAYDGTKFVLISPKELRVPDYIRELLENNDIEYKEVERLEDYIDELDILYMTRVQKERFQDENQYEKLKDSYILDTEKMDKAKENMIVMHPLPRVNEISVEVDKDERAVYFKQAEYGMYVRMALIIKLLEAHKDERAMGIECKDVEVGDMKCTNPNCITLRETYAPIKGKANNGKNGNCSCVYCDKIMS